MIHAVAIRYKGTTYTLPQPARHYNLIEMIAEDTGENFVFGQGEQGFLRDDGAFLNRVEAGKHALECGQVSKLHVGDALYSEEVW